MNGYLVPANAKRGTLILNVFRPFDIIMFGTGLIVTLLLLVLIPSDQTIMILVSCLPAGITGLLVVPIPNYHNVLCILQNIYNYLFVDVNELKWRGWCCKDEYKD